VLDDRVADTPAAVRRTVRSSSVARCAIAVSFALALGAAWVLRSSPFPPNGVGGDQSFRIASIARAAASLVPGDFAYQGLPVFYPPLSFAFLGRVVAMTGIPSYEAMKLSVVLTAFSVPVVAFAMWRRVTADAVLALGIAVAGLAVPQWYEPYSWIALTVFVPWWFLFVVRIERTTGVGSPRTLIGALIGAAIFMTYYYAFFIGAVHLVGVLASHLFVSRRRDARLHVSRESWLVLLGAAGFSAPYWAPVLIQVASGAAFTSLQNRYFEASMITPPMPFMHVSVTGLVALVGLASIVLGGRRSSVLHALGSFLVAAYIWYVLGVLATLEDVPVLAFRAGDVIDAVLAIAAGIGIVDGVRFLGARFPVLTTRRVVMCSCVTVVAVLVVSALSAVPYLAEQHRARVPTALLRSFDRAVGTDTTGVVLAGTPELAPFRPIYVFNVTNAHYANPLAEFKQRSRFIARLSRVQDPAIVAAALRHNRYDGVSSVVFSVVDDGIVYVDYQDTFPRGTRRRVVNFKRAQFSERWFEATTTDRYVIFVAKSDDPLDSLSDDQARELRTRFPKDLDSSARQQ